MNSTAGFTWEAEFAGTSSAAATSSLATFGTANKLERFAEIIVPLRDEPSERRRIAKIIGELGSHIGAAHKVRHVCPEWRRYFGEDGRQTAIAFLTVDGDDLERRKVLSEALDFLADHADAVARERISIRVR